ncbi:MAG: hypothetical protein V4633_08810 [Pseudomonadota bacterium]
MRRPRTSAGRACVRAFVAGQTDDVDAIRLRACRSKYTVYDEIILLDLAGNNLLASRKS